MPVCGLLVISLSHWTNFWHLTPENMSIQKYGLYIDSHFWSRSADFEICLCVIIALQLAQSYLMSAIKPCTYSLLERVLVPPWLAGHVQPWGGGGFTEKMQKKTLKVNHGWPWFGKAFLNHSQPWLTMVWQSFSKPWSTMVNHRFVKWPPQSTMVDHGWQKHCQPWLTMVGKSTVNHGQPWLVKALSTMVNHAWLET